MHARGVVGRERRTVDLTTVAPIDVRTLLTAARVVVGSSEQVDLAWRRLVQQLARQAVVCIGEDGLGIVDARDPCFSWALHRGPGTRHRVLRLVTSTPAACPGIPLPDVCRALDASSNPAVLVMTAQGEPAGIVTSCDVVHPFAAKVPP